MASILKVNEIQQLEAGKTTPFLAAKRLLGKNS